MRGYAGGDGGISIGATKTGVSCSWGLDHSGHHLGLDIVKGRGLCGMCVADDDVAAAGTWDGRPMKIGQGRVFIDEILFPAGIGLLAVDAINRVGLDVVTDDVMVGGRSGSVIAEQRGDSASGCCRKDFDRAGKGLHRMHLGPWGRARVLNYTRSGDFCRRLRLN